MAFDSWVEPEVHSVPTAGISIQGRECVAPAAAAPSRYSAGMGWWVPKPAIAASEDVLWTRGANREQSPLRYTGGRLLLTSNRLIFQPNRLDALTRGLPWSADLASVAKVGVEPRGPTVPFLGLTARYRNRLRVELQDGQVEVFVINHLATVVPLLTAALNEHRQH